MGHKEEGDHMSSLHHMDPGMPDMEEQRHNTVHKPFQGVPPVEQE